VNKVSVQEIAVSGKRTLVRVDFNVPVDEKSGKIMDDSRIRAALPTIQFLIDKGARVILASHLGRPDGKVVASMRMTPVAVRLSELLGKKVATAIDCIGPEVEKASTQLKNGEVLLLENLRFHAEEEANAPDFAASLARVADIYVDDAFGTAHRKHASIVGVTRHLPAVAGLLMEKELQMLGNLLADPQHPFCALLGGAKISDKVGLLQSIMGKVDRVLVGGGMAATFLKAKGLETGQSMLESDRIVTAKQILADAENRHIRLLLPIDVVVANNLTANNINRVVLVNQIPVDMKIADIGPKSADFFREQLSDCRTVFWNGPMGVYEIPPFDQGTKIMAETMAGLNANTVIGGGSTADVVTELGLDKKMTFVSTGGGASLALLSGEKLPGVEALIDKGGK
jgi:phosphoglycerate kinase